MMNSLHLTPSSIYSVLFQSKWNFAWDSYQATILDCLIENKIDFFFQKGNPLVASVIVFKVVNDFCVFVKLKDRKFEIFNSIEIIFGFEKIYFGYLIVL